MKIGIPLETYPGERRVALVPTSLAPLLAAKFEVRLQVGAGLAAGHPDAAYVEKGATLAQSREELFGWADILVMARGPGANPAGATADINLLGPQHLLIAFMEPLAQPELSQRIAQRGARVMAMELIPRITRAQGMDALSSMASIAGYLAALRAANRLPKFMPMMMTAAGNVAPAKVFVIGAGVAGLQACATAKRLGGVVSAYDTRPVVKEQVQSVGARFIELPLEVGGAQDKGGYANAQSEEFYRKQRELMTQTLHQSDIVITTAAVPGRKSPILITRAMVEAMQPGSIIVDLAAEKGGNCELTRAGEEVTHNGVLILGPLNLPSDLPVHASQLYSRNIQNLLVHLADKQGGVRIDLQDEITRAALVSHEGAVIHPMVIDAMKGASS